MTLLDLLILIFVVALAVRGFRHGAVIGVSSLLGFLGGVWIGTRLAGKLLTEGNQSPYAPLLALSAALVVGMIIGELALSLGFKVRVRFTSHVARRVDGTIGALLLGAFGLGLVWVGAAAVMQSRAGGDLRDGFRRSVVVKRLNAIMPPSSGLLDVLARVDPLRQIKGPSTNVPAPDPAVPNNPNVRLAAASTVRVSGTACGYGVEGSGWVGDTGLVVTNAHVVAGQSDTIVQPGGFGPAVPATTVWFDSRNDLALLSVPGLTVAPLQLRTDTRKGLSAAIIGYPLNGPLDVEPARIGVTQQAISDDIYGGGPITRLMTSFRGLVRHGNSGGPIVDEDGFVRGTVFASQSGSDDRRGYGVPGKVVREALDSADRTVAVSTGACA
ncbi:MAG: MarP family serine protease [Actinobacteria bacterium]|nr:MarP family serine protease [Actinomycetota bacterium]